MPLSGQRTGINSSHVSFLSALVHNHGDFLIERGDDYTNAIFYCKY